MRGNAALAGKSDYVDDSFGNDNTNLNLNPVSDEERRIDETQKRLSQRFVMKSDLLDLTLNHSSP